MNLSPITDLLHNLAFGLAIIPPFEYSSNIMELGIIFDWDGTLVDSSEQHNQSWGQLAKEAGFLFSPEAHHEAIGSKNERLISQVFGWTQDPAQIQAIALRKEEIYREVIQKNPVKLIPGALELLVDLAKYSIPCAIGSSTPRKNIEAVFQKRPLNHYFKAIITGDDVTNSKPHPEVFLKAAKAINCPPINCIVFEDAHLGITAALAAGMKAIALTTSLPKHMFSDAHHVVSDLTEINLSELNQLLVH